MPTHPPDAPGYEGLPGGLQTVLVPVDGTPESERALEYAVAIAEKYDADVHALYVFGEDIVRAIERGTVDEEAVADETQSFLDDAETVAEAHDTPFGSSTAYGFSTHRKTQHPGSVILDTAEAVDADFVVIPREPLTGEPGEILSKAAEYVLLYASQPVLSV